MNGGETLPRLLIVDDDAGQLTALCDTLQMRGYRPTGAASAEQALSMLRQSGFDLLLTDMRMPGMDGIVLLRAALAVDPDLVCIMMTGEGTIESAVDAMKSGALDYVLKPIKLSTLMPVLARATTVRRLRQEKAVLERRVHERTRELEQANRELDAFAHSASHDLRSPLNAVIGFSELLLTLNDPPLQGKAREFAHEIGVAGREMNALINDLLRLSNVSRCSLNRVPVDLSALAAQVVERLQRAEPNRQVAIDIEPRLVAEGDEGLFRVALDNLLGNAWKYTSNAEQARISFRAVATPDGQPAYAVRDNGVGFDMARAQLLFEPFQRLHSDIDFPGTGLGLSIVRRIVERHFGRVWAESAPGQGACFSFTLGGSGW